MFSIQPWVWREEESTLSCRYRVRNDVFEETYRFPVQTRLNEDLARSFDLIAVTSGVSYYKTVADNDIHLEEVAACDKWDEYVSSLYDEGLREFRFQNCLPLEFLPGIEVGQRNSIQNEVRQHNPSGALVAMGGGRDSLLVAFALRSESPTLLTIGSNPLIDDQARKLGLKLLRVERQIDPLLFRRNAEGALNGHVPVTAINSSVAIAVSIMTGLKDVIFSNEKSASVPTRVIDGVPINHQYSKGIEFETLLRQMLTALGLPANYFSALRGLGELEISQLVGRYWNKLPFFVSCNRTRAGSAVNKFPRWCCDCSKCYFVFVALSPYVSRSELIRFFGRDLMGEIEDIAKIDRLLLQEDRDFECIGTMSETLEALTAAVEGEWCDVSSLARLVNSHAAPVGIRANAVDEAVSFVPDHYKRLISAL